jgi:hypothetical protein
MNIVPLRSLVASLLLAGSGLAQAPSDRPPWWGVVDDVTVSLYWDFAGGSLTPTSVVAPSWYDPNVTAGTLSGAAAPIPALAGQNGVIGVVGNGSPRAGALTMTVDNDAHIGWVKVFYFQFDVFEGASGAVVEQIVQDLQKYDRSAVEWSSQPLVNGWQRVTVAAQLYPQPDDETLAWSFVENAFGTVAIDNLFVNSKCVKVDESDQDGLAMGTTVLGPIDLSALTAQSDCVAVAVTEGPAPAFARTLFVGVRAPGVGASHQLVRLQGGAVIGTTPVPGWRRPRRRGRSIWRSRRCGRRWATRSSSTRCSTNAAVWVAACGWLRSTRRARWCRPARWRSRRRRCRVSRR